MSDKVLDILCGEEGTAVSSGLSEYFGDTEETISEALADESAAAAFAAARADAYDAGAAAAGSLGHRTSARALLSDVLSPTEVGLPFARRRKHHVP